MLWIVVQPQNNLKLKKGSRYRDPISAYLFILVLEIVFPISIFGYDFLYTAYADDTTFFIRNKNSVIVLLNIFDIFSIIYGLKPNKSKYEIARRGKLKVVYMALCGLKGINEWNWKFLDVISLIIEYCNKKTTIKGISVK